MSLRGLNEVLQAIVLNQAMHWSWSELTKVFAARLIQFGMGCNGIETMRPRPSIDEVKLVEGLSTHDDLPILFGEVDTLVSARFRNLDALKG